MKDILLKILDLQKEYSSENTPAMKERGVLIRQALPDALTVYKDRFSNALGEFASDMLIEGRDGIGRKTPAPWLRISNSRFSPSATQGYYLVIHFAQSGEQCFLTLGCSATSWNPVKGDLDYLGNEEVDGLKSWALNVVAEASVDVSNFKDQIDIGSNLRLPRAFERATILCKAVPRNELDTIVLLDHMCSLLGILSLIYHAQANGREPSRATHEIEEVFDVVNPVKSRQRGQGYGLTGPERKAVEIRAMEVVKTELESMGFTVKDVSANSPFDFEASSEYRRIKVEVKGSTADRIDAFLMTVNEVRLHTEERGGTMLALVSGIRLSCVQNTFTGQGGVLELIDGWDIDSWASEPISYRLKRI